jgi:hypothetical protein
MSAPNDRDRDASRTQELLLLGQIHGLVQGLKEGQDATNRRIDAMSDRFDERLDAVDGRLRTVEQKAAVAGALSGGAMAVGTALIIEGVKTWLRGGPGN